MKIAEEILEKILKQAMDDVPKNFKKIVDDFLKEVSGRVFQRIHGGFFKILKYFWGIF